MPEFQNADPSELRLIYDLAPVGIGAIDRDLRFVRVNKRLAEINGLDPRDHAGRRIDEVAPRLSGAVEPSLRSILDGERTQVEMIVAADDGNGETLWRFRMSALERTNGTPSGAVVVVDEVVDIDEVRRGADRQRIEYAHLANAVPMIVLSLGPDGSILYSNPRWNELTGDHSDIERLERLAHPTDAETVSSLLETDDGKPERTFCEARLRDSAGTYRWYMIEAQPIDVDSGDDFHWYVTCTDIEKQKRIESKLRQRTEVLIAEDRRKDEFLAVLGHEIRNPVAAMEGAVLTLCDGRPADHDWAIDVLRSQLAQVTRLVDDLLDDARIRQGKITLRRDTVDVASLLAVSVEGVRQLASDKSVSIELELPAQPLAIEADESRLEQVVANLVSNAVRYTPSGGSVGVTAEVVGNDLLIKVADDGIGIHPDRLSTIFEPFVQLDNDQRCEQEGLGVGLSLAKRLVQLHGGHISAHSDGEGHGATFEVLLPDAVRRGHIGHSVEDTGASDRWRQVEPLARSILLVDDNEPALLGLKRLLEAAGCDVQTALTGKDAWQAFCADAVDVAILDIGLPDISGHELARTFRRAAAASDQPLLLVALTGYGHSKARKEARAAGFDHHLLKPVDFQELMRLIRL